MEKIIIFLKSQQFLTFLVGLLVISNGVTVYFLANQNNGDQQSNQASVNDIQDNGYPPDPKFNPPVLGPEVDITVDWLDQPALVDVQSFFGNDYLTKEYNLNYPSQDGYPPSMSYAEWLKTMQVYQVGKVNTAGKYLNKDLFIVASGSMYTSPIERIIKNGNDLVYLTNAQDYSPEYFRNKKVDNIHIANLETPTVILVPNANLALGKSEAEPMRFFSDYANLKEQFKFYNGVVYQDLDTNCFLVKASDGTARQYYFNLPFSGVQGQSSQYFGIVPSILDFYWLDGSKNSNEYLSDRYASGYHQGCFGYADYITDDSLLNKVGQNKNGDVFYELKRDIKIKYYEQRPLVLRGMYDAYYPGYDETTQQQKQKITFADFLKTHPIIYWQDPFGRFIEFKNAKYLPVAEMGKPVIYLYPEHAMDVKVEVSPTGGFTKTEPEYNNGWNVSAKPTGELYNYADSKTYPYLFWEGIGLNYERPKEGFVVKKEEVKNFLENKLAQAGLIKREYDEFIDFWLPKMQSDPYYFITFVPQEQFSQMAPLKVSPQPNTVIRVFMDYQGLTKPVTVKAQDIKTPVRKGFTVVEWGGQLRH